MTDVALLMARDPLSLTRENIDTLISIQRANRHLFNSGIKVGAAPKKAIAAAKQALPGTDLSEFKL